MGSIFDPYIQDDALLKAAVGDAVRLCERRSSPRLIGFLDERQRAAAEGMTGRVGSVNTLFYGGYADAERRMLGIFPDFMQPDEAVFPIAALGFCYRKGVNLSHRDFLGTILSCGVKREKVGDILCGDGLTVVFAERTIACFLAGQIERVGGEGVSIQSGFNGDLPGLHTFREIRYTVASPRLDSVVKTAAGISREEAAQRIAAGLVAVNHIVRVSVSYNVKETDVISVRGAGRFRVKSLGPQSRKARLFITIEKFE